MGEQDTAGVEFARALAARDAERLLELLHPEIEFRALTPRRSWEADDPEATIAILLGQWFEASDHIDAVERLESDAFADRQRVGYRFSVSNARSAARAGSIERSGEAQTTERRAAMLARVSTWEGGTAEEIRAAAAEMRSNLPQGPPPGLKSNGLTMLIDPEGARVLMIGLFASEDDLRDSEPVLAQMNPPAGLGRRTAVDVYEVAAEARM